MNVMDGWWRRGVDYFVSDAVRARGSDAIRRAHFVLAATAIALPLGMFRAASFFVTGPETQGVAVVAAGAALVVGAFVMRRTGSVTTAGNLFVLVSFLLVCSLAYRRGGIGTPALTTIAVVPLLALLFAQWRSALVWTGLCIIVVIAFAALGDSFRDQFPQEAKPALEATGHIAWVLLVFGIGAAYEATRTAAMNARDRAIHERSALAGDLSRAEQEAKLLRADRMASVGQLAAGVAHEANNPLAYVITNLAFVQKALANLRADDPQTVRELSEAIDEARQGADRVTRIVRDLKAFAREDEEELVRVDIAEVLDSTLKMAANEIRHRATLQRRYDEVPTVRANDGRLVQVFLNLLVNAAQAIPEGHADDHRITVTVREATGGGVSVEVRDTGCGIDPANRDRVLEPFFTTKPVGVGTGLGLTVCQSILEGYGGTLELDSEPGAGTTATVTLPAANSETVASRTRVVAPPPPSPERRHRILLVDDEPLVLRSLKRILRPHTVVSARSGRGALEILEDTEPFDVILCDMMMPDLTGVDVYEALAADGRGFEERMVFLTGGAFTKRTEAFLERIPNRRLDKPVTPDRLRAAIDEVTERAAVTEAPSAS